MTDPVAALAPVLSASLIAMDFDGTLSAIVAVPSEARAADGALEALTALARRGAQIAIVTGRDVPTVLELSGLEAVPGLIVSGLHGAQRWQGGQLASRAEPAGIAQLRQSLPPLLARVDPDVWLEDKGLSLVVHARRCRNPEAVLAALNAEVRASATEAGLEVLPGKAVLEIRIPGLSKADALRELLTEDRTGALFAGDDHGDLPGFAEVGRWRDRTGHPGVTIAVGDVPDVVEACDVSVAGPPDFVRTLTELSLQSLAEN